MYSYSIGRVYGQTVHSHVSACMRVSIDRLPHGCVACVSSGILPVPQYQWTVTKVTGDIFMSSKFNPRVGLGLGGEMSAKSNPRLRLRARVRVGRRKAVTGGIFMSSKFNPSTLSSELNLSLIHI